MIKSETWRLVGRCLGMLLLAPRLAQAFPEMVRAGYTNCTTCHVSPIGGGLLTEYGRNLSSEVLSTWGTSEEAQIGHGLLYPKAAEGSEGKEPPDRWFGLGGDLRAAQAFSENRAVKVSRFIWMQAQVDFAYRYKSWTAVLSAGQFDNRGKGQWVADSERYYLMKQINDENLVRVGRFLPAFGLNIPEHISPTRGGTQGNGLGFGIFQERDGVEWNFIGETWNAALGYNKGPRDRISELEESAYAQIQKAFYEHYKIGLSMWSGHRASSKRQIIAAHGLLGFSSRLYLLTEVDVQLQQPNVGHDQTGIFGYHKLGYEFYKGMHVFALYDHLQPDLSDGRQFIHHWGGGLQFFPRPHFEVTGAWTRELDKSLASTECDYAWILMHYYL